MNTGMLNPPIRLFIPSDLAVARVPPKFHIEVVFAFGEVGYAVYFLSYLGAWFPEGVGDGLKSRPGVAGRLGYVWG
jgi:hypothetical protein